MTCISNCLLAFLRKVCALEPCCLLANFCAVFFSSPPSLFISGPGKGKNILVGKDSTDQFIVTVPVGGPLQGCHGLYLLPCARALPGSTNFWALCYDFLLLKSVFKLSVKKITDIFLGCQQNCWLWEFVCELIFRSTMPWILGVYIYSQSFA